MMSLKRKRGDCTVEAEPREANVSPVDIAQVDLHAEIIVLLVAGGAPCLNDRKRGGFSFGSVRATPHTTHTKAKVP
jgi:hypothetical protein